MTLLQQCIAPFQVVEFETFLLDREGLNAAMEIFRVGRLEDVFPGKPPNASLSCVPENKPCLPSTSLS